MHRFISFLVALVALFVFSGGIAAQAQSLIASNSNKKQHEITMNQRHYKVMVPRTWKMYDDSHKGHLYTDVIKIDVQSVAPAKDAVIMFFYHGQPIDTDSARVFHQLIQDHKGVVQAESLDAQQIKALAIVLDTPARENQYDHDPASARFHLSSAKIININARTPMLSVEGDWRNDSGTDKRPQRYWQCIYIDGTGDGLNVHEIQYSASTKASFEHHKPVFDQIIKSLQW